MQAVTWQSLNWFDYSILAILALSLLTSLFRGFLREAVSLVTWIVGIMVALKFARPLGQYLQPYVHSQTMRYVAAFVTIFMVALVIGGIINAIVRILVSKSGTGMIDRMLGAFFGIARGILLIGVVLLLIHVSGLQDSPVVVHSQLSPRFNGVVNWLGNYLPEKVQKVSNWAEGIVADQKPVDSQSSPSQESQ